MERLTSHIIPNIYSPNKKLKNSKETWVQRVVNQIDDDINRGVKISQLFFLTTNPDTNSPYIAAYPYSTKNGETIKALIKASV